MSRDVIGSHVVTYSGVGRRSCIVVFCGLSGVVDRSGRIGGWCCITRTLALSMSEGLAIAYAEGFPDLGRDMGGEVAP